MLPEFASKCEPKCARTGTGIQLNWDEKYIWPIEYTRWLFIITLLFRFCFAAAHCLDELMPTRIRANEAIIICAVCARLYRRFSFFINKRPNKKKWIQFVVKSKAPSHSLSMTIKEIQRKEKKRTNEWKSMFIIPTWQCVRDGVSDCMNTSHTKVTMTANGHGEIMSICTGVALCWATLWTLGRFDANSGRTISICTGQWGKIDCPILICVAMWKY